jgi:microcystin-dependent protein
MSEPYLGELRLMSWAGRPKGWAQANGQFLPINQNQALFALLGTMYGGNGQTTFALPDLRGRVAVHVQGNTLAQGTAMGRESHTLVQAEMPAHSHVVVASSANGNQAAPSGNLLAAALNQYHPPSDLTTLVPATVTNVGGSQAHENRPPHLVLNWCIALQGIFPSRN